MYTKKMHSILLLPIEETPIGCEHLNKSTELFENLLESRGPLAKRRVRSSATSFYVCMYVCTLMWACGHCGLWLWSDTMTMTHTCNSCSNTMTHTTCMPVPSAFHHHYRNVHTQYQMLQKSPMKHACPVPTIQ